MPMPTKSRLHFEKVEEKVLDQLVKMGLFADRDEAARAAILKYGMDIGLLNREVAWRGLEKGKRRKITPEQLAKDLETLENET